MRWIFIVAVVLLLPVVSAVVTIDDFLFVVEHLGTNDSTADVTTDGIVNLFDLVSVATHLGSPRSMFGWNGGEDSDGESDSEQDLSEENGEDINASTPPPHLDFRFDEFSSTEELLENTMGLGLWRNDQDIALDTVQPLGGPANSMRYRYPDLTDESTRCDDRHITSGATLPENTTEVWIEVVVRFMEGFTTRSPSEWDCPGANDLKFVYIPHSDSGTGDMPFLAYASSVGLNSNSIRLRTPSDVGAAAFSDRSQEELFSGEWITLRFHARIPSEPDALGDPGSGSGDGLYRLWWDDDLELEIANMSTAAYQFSHLLFGQNMNQGQNSPQDMWWNRIRVWTENPGW